MIRRPALLRRPSGPLHSEERWAWLFLAPTLIGLAGLSAGPILAAFAISLTSWDLLTPPTFVGLENFAGLLRDDRFLQALRNTSFYTAVSVPLGLVLSLALALPLNARLRGIAWLRTAFFLPVVSSTVAVALVWAWIYSPDQGLLNVVLRQIGLPTSKWISDPFWAMPAVIAMSVWQGLGIGIIIFLAGLQAIPEELYDAAEVDGAGALARLRHVTLPLLTPSIFFTGILSFIGAFQVFEQIYVLTSGRPSGGTITLVYFIYENGFRFFKMGYASAASWILFLIVAVLTLIYFRSQSRWVHYQ